MITGADGIFRLALSAFFDENLPNSRSFDIMLREFFVCGGCAVLEWMRSDPLSFFRFMLYRAPAVLLALILHEIAHGLSLIHI